jgi:hypothetical protein
MMPIETKNDNDKAQNGGNAKCRDTATREKTIAKRNKTSGTRGRGDDNIHASIYMTNCGRTAATIVGPRMMTYLHRSSSAFELVPKSCGILAD